MRIVILLTLIACNTFQPPIVHHYHFPSTQAFLDKPDRPFEKIGVVRAKVNYQSLDPSHEEDALCRNYYNKAVRQLVTLAEAKGAQAVIQVQSVVFYENGRQEFYSTPECSDDGLEGQSLVTGVAIRYTDH